MSTDVTQQAVFTVEGFARKLALAQGSVFAVEGFSPGLRLRQTAVYVVESDVPYPSQSQAKGQLLNRLLNESAEGLSLPNSGPELGILLE